MKHVAFQAILLASLVSGVAQETKTGSVQGTVIDQYGRTVARVKVYCVAETGVIWGLVPSATTDDNGSFLLSRLPPGEHRLFAVFTEAGYPDGRSGIFADDPSLYEPVKVEAGQTLTSVILRLPKKGAVFRAHIVDLATGKPVLSSRIHVTRADMPNVFYESGPNRQGQFEIVLVPNLPFRIEIRAANYKGWQYSRIDNQGRETQDLVLRPETTEEVTVELEAVPQAKIP
jgi:hypothetical protein